MAIDREEPRLTTRDLGLGKCPAPTPKGDRVLFLLGIGQVPGEDAWLCLMEADGSGRSRLGGL